MTPDEAKSADKIRAEFRDYVRGEFDRLAGEGAVRLLVGFKETNHPDNLPNNAEAVGASAARLQMLSVLCEQFVRGEFAQVEDRLSVMKAWVEVEHAVSGRNQPGLGGVLATIMTR